MDLVFCGAAHPDDPSLTCEQTPEPPHEWHATKGLYSKEWRNEDYAMPPRAPRGSQRKTEAMVDIARRAQPVRHAVRLPSPTLRSSKVRRDHPDTSHNAAERIMPRSGTQRHAVLSLIAASDGLTDAEIQDGLRISESSERPRRIELVEQGWIEDSGVRRIYRGHEEAIVWVLTSQGRREWSS